MLYKETFQIVEFVEGMQVVQELPINGDGEISVLDAYYHRTLFECETIRVSLIALVANVQVLKSQKLVRQN